MSQQREEVVTDIPEAELPRVIVQYTAIGATFTVKKQPNGLWTLTAIITG